MLTQQLHYSPTQEGGLQALQRPAARHMALTVALTSTQYLELLSITEVKPLVVLCSV